MRLGLDADPGPINKELAAVALHAVCRKGHDSKQVITCTASVWPVLPLQTASYVGPVSFPCVYPTLVSVTPGTL